jgi:cysteine synthase
MRKILGVLWIAALTLTACGSTANEQTEIESDAVMDDTASHEAAQTIRLFGAIVFEGDEAVLMGEQEENCMIAEPTTTTVVNNLETAEVTIEDDSGQILAETEFQTFHDDERCSWLIDVAVESGSEYFVAHFENMATPKAYASDYEDGFLELDVTTPVMEEIESR